MQRPLGALTQNFRLISTEDSSPLDLQEKAIRKTQVVSAIYLSGHLLTPTEIGPPCFHKIHCGVVSNKKDKYLTPAHSLKTTRSSHIAQYCRCETYSDALENSFFPKLVFLLRSPVVNTQTTQRSIEHSSFSKKKLSQKIFYPCQNF